jgi:hypothetical protein
VGDRGSKYVLIGSSRWATDARWKLWQGLQFVHPGPPPAAAAAAPGLLSLRSRLTEPEGPEVTVYG